MSSLKFKKSEMLNLLSGLKADDKLMLVKDHGIYIMSFAQEPGKRVIVYAEGFNPNDKSISEFWDDQQDTFGGDDGADEIGTAANLFRLVWASKTHLKVSLTATQIKMVPA